MMVSHGNAQVKFALLAEAAAFGAALPARQRGSCPGEPGAMLLC